MSFRCFSQEFGLGEVRESRRSQRNKGIFGFARGWLFTGVLSHDYSTIIVKAKLIY